MFLASDFFKLSCSESLKWLLTNKIIKTMSWLSEDFVKLSYIFCFLIYLHVLTKFSTMAKEIFKNQNKYKAQENRKNIVVEFVKKVRKNTIVFAIMR